MNLRRLILAAALASTAAPAAVSTAAPDAAEARAEARKAHLPLVLLADGAQFAPDSADVRKAFEAARAGLKSASITGIQDYSTKDAGDTPAWNLPAFVVTDADGRPFATLPGLRKSNMEASLARLSEILSATRERDALWSRAKTASGITRATLLGKGLDLMDAESARRRKDVIEEIRKADPSDESGYHFRYTFEVAAWHERTVDKVVGSGTPDTLLADIGSKLAAPGLDKRQRQLLLTGRFRIFFASDRMAEAQGVLRDIVAVDPGSDMGVGAARYLKELTLPVRLEALSWRARDNRPLFLPMIADVSASVVAPGTYEIEFRHRTGHTRFRKVWLESGGVTLASDGNASENGKVRLRVETTPRGPVELHAESRGTGWFEGAGDIVVRKAD